MIGEIILNLIWGTLTLLGLGSVYILWVLHEANKRDGKTTL